jgi:D-3-phosphoglycerate dehydrogenase / 2-oxoglutarate reductase
VGETVINKNRGKMTKKVLIAAEDVHSSLPERLEALGYQTDFLTDASESGLHKVIGDYEGLIFTTDTKVDAALLSKAGALKWIGRMGSGLENVDEVAAAAKNIAILSSPEGNANAVGEHTLGLLLSIMNNITSAHFEVQHGIWQREENRGEELDGKTVGIIGLGNTGNAFAKKLRGFDVEILAYDKFKTGFTNKWLKETRLNKLMARADIISVHIPYNLENHHFINDEFFEMLNRPVYLLHTSRGRIADTHAIARALDSGAIKGLGIDVFEDEPWAKTEIIKRKVYKNILSNPRVVATPHVAGWSTESKERTAVVLVEKIAEFLQG